MAASGTIELHPSYGSSVIVLVDDQDPDDAGGIGGWQASTRMLDKPGRWFQGPGIDTKTIYGIVDLWKHAHNTSVETRLERLRKMGEPGKNREEPPIIKLKGDVPPWQRQLRWVLQDMELLARDLEAPGELQRQHLSLSLEGYYALPEVQGVSIKRTRAKGSDSPNKRIYVTKQGDTLRAIAVRELGTSGQYTAIQAVNPKLKKTDPDEPLRAGLKVVLK